mgnify:CR=1 FL=1
MSKFCKNCGTELADEAAFCKNCGTLFDLCNASGGRCYSGKTKCLDGVHDENMRLDTVGFRKNRVKIGFGQQKDTCT